MIVTFNFPVGEFVFKNQSCESESNSVLALVCQCFSGIPFEADFIRHDRIPPAL